MKINPQPKALGKAALIASLALGLAQVHAQTGYNARSVGMAGAYQGMARGSEAVNWNPANLGLPDNPNLSVEFLGVGLLLGNNSINVSLYNNYFSQDYFDQEGSWDSQAKSEILEHFPDHGFRGYNRAQFTAIAGSYRQFALSINSVAYADLRLPRELFAVPLLGLETEPIYLNDAWGEAVVATEIAFSGAQAIDLGWDKVQAFSVGGTVKYLLGHGYARIEEAGALLVSNQDSIAVDGHYRTLQAGFLTDEGGAGQGFALDLGAVAQVNEKLSVGLALTNLVGFIRFGSSEESQGNFWFHQPGLNLDEFDNFEDYMDSVTVEDDTTVAAGEIKYRLPAALSLSGTYKLNPQMTLELDYHQGLNRAAGGTTTPRVALGTEIRKLDFLPMRCGLALGGVQGSTFAIGLGLDLKHYQLDFSAANQKGFFNHSTGLSYALSQRILF
jgi:hypothetical protein